MSESDAVTVTVVVGGFDSVTGRGLAHVLREDRRLEILDSDLEYAVLERVVARHAPRVAIVGEAVDHSQLMRLKSRQPGTAVLVFTHDPSVLYRSMLLAAGATCLAHSASTEELITAIRLAAHGRRRSSSENGQGQSTPGKTRVLTQRELESLTASEIDTLKHLSRGLSNAQIALKMQRGEATIKTHSERI